ncbi:aldehyde dehydrogenase family protein [Bacillus dakarensis]|uniref:aldehyde dehydrogenase family protein n=1 Tax=Robertmurraya dakarensis TaxID=1926278 RepID=UPI0009814281|nr:aldehyde dehydrogenase family protein [Bacillus dakarensis]
MSTITKDFRMTINGKLVSTEDKSPVINPADEEVIAQVPIATKADLDHAVTSANRAYRKWSMLSVNEREEKLVAFAEALHQHREELAKLFTLEMGRPLKLALVEIDGAVATCKALSKKRLPREIVEEKEDHYIERTYTPLGVAGLIIPWNFPVSIAIRKITSALIAGNTVVAKPSPFTPLTLLRIGEITKDIFLPGVLNVVTGENELGQWMTSHPDIHKISFTGSTATGKKVMQSASLHLKRVTLELGGNDAAIVMEDANPKEIVETIFWAAFRNTAQVCVATKRLYVHEKIYDEFLTELVRFSKTIKIGNGLNPENDLGPIQNKMQFEKVKELIQVTKQSGVKIVLGGEIEDKPGYFIPVTIVDNPPEDSRVVVDEAFGPVLPVLKYSSYEEVIERANHTNYGLGGSVWGKDLELAKSIAERLDTGTVWINEAQVLSPDAPFGGHKESGMGVESSLDGIKEYTNSKTIMIRKK